MYRGSGHVTKPFLTQLPSTLRVT